MVKDFKQQWIDKCNKKYQHKYDYSKVKYIDNQTKVKIICPIHGPFYQTPESHLRSRYDGCIKCSTLLITKTKVLDRLKKINEKKFNNKYDYSLIDFDNLENGQRGFVKIICPDHGIFEQKLQSHLQGFECPKCGHINSSTTKRGSPDNRNKITKRFIKKAKVIHNDRYDYSLVDYSDKTLRDKVKIVCKDHGEFEQTWGNHITLKHGCPKCMYKRENYYINKFGTKKEKLKKFLKICNKKYNSYYDYSKVRFSTVSDYVTVICPEHGEFQVQVHNHMRRSGCPECSLKDRTSSGERELLKYIRTFYKGDIKNNVKNIIKEKDSNKHRELDIYIPDAGFAIEYCGEYYHSELYVDIQYHKRKLNLCNEKSIDLFTIFENEWKDDIKRKIIKSRIRHRLGFSKNKVYARECYVKPISLKKANRFLFFNHLQQVSISSVNLGLYFGDLLVSVMTFGKPRFNKNYEYELIRFSSKRNYSIPGAANKLFEYFLLNYDVNTIISYADLRYSTGNLYYNLRFELLRTSQPSPWFVKGNNVYHRTHMQKHKLKKKLHSFDSKKSALENLRDNGYHRLFDCGSKVYAWDINSNEKIQKKRVRREINRLKETTRRFRERIS